ncbi:zinc chelation protein SecC [Clostridium sporogenes]|uniref:Zinc chelation protein SecC n=2 Tax=Clostridium TaxID=1485 RepID=A0AAE5C587_CLOSG|nr:MULTISPECIES: SEC-C metal-binding domain-containing protein [Clostridium]KIS22572.1 zinc chelation protein SecC [Clostridium botulinum B2 450]MBE6077304.1 zinc chelation protein SecC [Clostridium lundense]MDU2832349.1 SEC-C metal-binding domain-containing protein [Clostridium botulinum]MCW7997599.1 zinc chelation protein SecC [Clostridium sp. cpc1]MDU4547842.1 SEC-C metal-binding domain-containing protein [Clostridium botulinum]
MSCNNIPELNEKNNLETLLNNLTKSDLTDIRKSLDVKGASKLNKKELVHVLESELQNNLNEVISNIGFYEYIFLDRYFDEIEYINKNTNKFDNAINDLKKKGIIFQIDEDKNKVVIPEELKDNIRENFIEEEEFNLGFYISKDILKVVQVLLHYYGALSLEELYEIIHSMSSNLNYGKDRNIEIEFDRSYLTNLLSDNNRSYYGIKKQDNTYYVEDVINLSYVLQGHKAIQYLDYKELSINYIRKFNKEEFYIKPLEKLNKYMKENLNIKEEKLNELMYSTSCLMKNAFSVDYIFEDIKGRIYLKNEEIERDIKDIITEINNNIEKWCLRGHSITEIKLKEDKIYEKVEKVNHKGKIGRNDPCPCGSGKKYKKCCLNK